MHKQSALAAAIALVAVCGISGCARSDTSSGVQSRGKDTAAPSASRDVRWKALSERGLAQEAGLLNKLGQRIRVDGASDKQLKGAAGLLAALGFTARKVERSSCDASALFQAAIDLERASADVEDAARLSEIVGVARFVERRPQGSYGDGFLGETELKMIQNWGPTKPERIIVRSDSGVRPDGVAVDTTSAPEPVKDGTYLVFASEHLYAQSAYERNAEPQSAGVPQVTLLFRALPIDPQHNVIAGGAFDRRERLDETAEKIRSAGTEVGGCR